MNPGDLNKRIVFQKSIGGAVVSTLDGEWEDVFSTWASVKPIIGREYYAAETINSNLTHKITIRYRPGINSKMRIKFKERLFNIVGPPINVDEGNKELVIMASEIE